MKEQITPFLDQKNISENSKIAYAYDLDQFVDEIHGRVTETNLRIYQASIKDFKAAVQKRKLSAVNQFLYFLYQNGVIEEFHRLTLPKVAVSKEQENELLDLSAFWEESAVPKGRLMALLILEMGLLPSEILQVKIEDIDLDFQILRIEKAGQKRIIKIPDSLLGELEVNLTGTYLFEKKGRSYSRQWGFRQLEAFLLEQGQDSLSAQSLREQFILRQREKGIGIYDIARDLGLKTIITLEKYR
ncbi:site-specific tyrosine recombinase XerD [Streptococcus panodentis]|uniref:Tyrosine recombinase XerD-like n=1 Tax=Streptococcus panodentis TaxID=1581472 RepID=A0ABS5AXB4_9STRE|nr:MULTISPECIES: site-specific tyrosine recombinase XerD [Streptococcus]KXT84705.1 Tyrosine recombinase XerD [Streptococcus sp. DD11]MBP2621224.1 site-specific tyrosine recombinase XerD [Streptococcus panodentis]